MTNASDWSYRYVEKHSIDRGNSNTLALVVFMHHGHARFSVDAEKFAYQVERTIRSGPSDSRQTKPDVKIRNEGSLMLVDALTEAATSWIEENVADPQDFGKALVVEARHARDLNEAMERNGLVVRPTVTVAGILPSSRPPSPNPVTTRRIGFPK
jgi:hypothetical protein